MIRSARAEVVFQQLSPQRGAAVSRHDLAGQYPREQFDVRVVLRSGPDLANDFGAAERPGVAEAFTSPSLRAMKFWPPTSALTDG